MSEKTIVLVTGANTGLGFEIVKSLYTTSTKPYHIIIGARSTEKGNAAISALQGLPSNKSTPDTLETVQIDLQDDKTITSAFETLQAKHPRIDALVNNAGQSFDNDQSVNGDTRQMWNKTWDVNVTGTQILTSTFMPLLLKSSDPRLLFLTSGLATLNGAADPNSPRYINPPAGWPKPAGLIFIAYRSSKAALNMMMLDWHRILKNDGVKVWSISPGLLATGLGRIPGGPELLKKMGAEDPALGGNFVRDVVEGKRDEDVGKVVSRQGVQPW